MMKPDPRGRKKQEYNKFIEQCKAKLAEYDKQLAGLSKDDPEYKRIYTQAAQ